MLTENVHDPIDEAQDPNCHHHIPAFGLLPARMREISKPRLKAWLNRSRVWKVDINGNHEQMAMGTKMIIPMPASYSRARERTIFHKPNFFTIGFHATPICKTKKPKNKMNKHF